MNQWLQQLHQLEPWRIMRHDINHIYIRPCRPLQQVVAHYTVTFPQAGAFLPLSGQGEMLTLLPDISGCFVFGVGGQGRFWGPTTKAVQVPIDFNEVPMRFFVEFLPGGASCVTGAAVQELADEILDGENGAPYLFRQIQHFIDAGLPLPELLQKTEEALLAGLAQHCKPERAQLLELIKEQSNMQAAEMADKVGYSQRHLQRLFLENFGIGMKACARVIRINNTVAQLTPETRLLDLAQHSGYYDQAHFNHDFKQICGVTPKIYLERMSNFYKEEYKF